MKIVCDNLKTGVTSHPRRGGIILNEAYLSLGEYYSVAIMPTGVKKPKQKASVEGPVGKIATTVIAKLRNDSFTSLAELNAGIRKTVKEFNDRPFQKRPGSRRSIFETEEKPYLRTLPLIPYEVCEWSNIMISAVIRYWDSVTVIASFSARFVDVGPILSICIALSNK